MTDDLIDAARDIWIKAVYDYGGQSIPGEGEERATRVIADYISNRIEAMIAARDKMADTAEHGEECNFRLWAEKCDCGLADARKDWHNLAGKDEG